MAAYFRDTRVTPNAVGRADDPRRPGQATWHRRSGQEPALHRRPALPGTSGQTGSHALGSEQ